MCLAGTIGASIMAPWVERLEALGGRVLAGHRMRDLRLDAGGAAAAVLADAPDGPRVRMPPGCKASTETRQVPGCMQNGSGVRWRTIQAGCWAAAACAACGWARAG